ncbi:hypothetical protein MYCTH_2115844 [Thermothelomyces thermophilus ATCC 42464]|uniref:Uncharacterized protein n=1 Tax=Thermothelomyces thermophilus (strain ATCC 42464 / BCRC 31852 / DSM 1799) TaxID=573729 RepID=G2Q2G1_THET4|nr:uncharacterized protein MYCTH_2115844 [Thermothelomyces thermophilus ATCC 42464]AEO55086.1 hypothetical protein MYCTH_2115844 [Thermothelomyces thermophilus ATCC 42464]
MWDRFKIVPQNAGRQIDHPLDDDRIRVGLGIGYGGQNAPRGYSYSIKGGPAPPRPPREFFESQYETVPVVKEPPRCNPNRITARAADFRPTSSVYSQDSLPYVASYAVNYTATVATKYNEDDGPEYHHTAGIPPSTGAPINDRSGWSYAPEPRQAPQSPPRNRGTASIPAMRRERRRQSDAATRDSRANQPGAAPQQTRNPPAREAPRWDPLTGEQANSARGRPAQVKPAEYAQGPGIPPQAWTEPRKSPTAAPPSFTDRVKRIAKKAAAAREGSTDPAAGAFTSSRPGWRGASGRIAIVDPVYDNPNVPPLQIPEKSSKRNVAVATGPKSNLTPEGPVRRDQTPPVSPPASETPTRSAAREAIRRILPSAHSPAATQTQQHQTGQGYPSPPLPENSARDGTPAVAAARELVCDGHYGAPAHPNPPLQSPESSNQFRRKPPPPVQTNPQHQHQVSVSSVYSQQTNAPHPSPLPLPDNPQPAENAEEPYVPPPSRFSITTYATSNTGTTRDDADEHPNEDQPPVPSLPADHQQQHADGGRPSFDHNSPATSPPQPIPRSHPSASAEQQTPASTSTAAAAAATSATVAPNPAVGRALAQDRPSSRASDINKTLPPAPPEQSADQAQDRVGLLNAQLRSLANRRININRSIEQMTQLMPTDKLMNSAEVVRKREIEKQKVEALRQELADVQREEHELGLKLHRAYKRLDREAEWEPTTLWVRRVTG